MSTVKRAYRYRFYPTDEQKQQLARTFGCCRYVYNWLRHEVVCVAVEAA
jgi:putative transposase